MHCKGRRLAVEKEHTDNLSQTLQPVSASNMASGLHHQPRDGRPTCLHLWTDLTKTGLTDPPLALVLGFHFWGKTIRKSLHVCVGFLFGKLKTPTADLLMELGECTLAYHPDNCLASRRFLYFGQSVQIKKNTKKKTTQNPIITLNTSGSEMSWISLLVPMETVEGDLSLFLLSVTGLIQPHTHTHKSNTYQNKLIQRSKTSTGSNIRTPPGCLLWLSSSGPLSLLPWWTCCWPPDPHPLRPRPQSPVV